MLRALARIIYSSTGPDPGPCPADPVPPSTSTSPSPPPPSATRRRTGAPSYTPDDNDNGDTDMLDPDAASANPQAPASPTSSSSTRPPAAAHPPETDQRGASSTANKRTRSHTDSPRLETSAKRSKKAHDEPTNMAPEEPDQGHADGPMTKAMARRFDNQGPGAGNYKRMTGPAFNAPIYIGDVVEMRSDGASTGGWYGCVELIRALNESVTKIRDRDPLKADDLPQYRSTEVGLKLSWFYSKADLEALDGEAGKACQGATALVGPNERVKGDCEDWNWQTMIVSKQPELMYVFNDSYPHRAPLKHITAWHPLEHYSTRELRKVAPSTRHFPALETPSRFPDDLPPLPNYYFGVGYPGYEAPEAHQAKADGHTLKDEPLPGQGDGVRQIPYVRVGFSFRPQQAEVDEALASTAAGKKAKARGGPKWVHELIFNGHNVIDPTNCEHSSYNPRKVQRFSHRAHQWYDVDRLFATGHYRWKTASTPTQPSPAPVTPKPAPHPPVTPQRRRPTFTIEIPPPRTPSSRMPRRPAAAAAASRSRSSSSPAPPRAERYPPPAPRSPPPAHYAEDASFDSEVYPSIALHELARRSMMRGGAYGLTGNAYLVDRASILSTYLRVSGPDADELTPEAREELWDEARGLLESYAEWDAEVLRRVRWEGGAAALAPEWRSDGYERLGRLAEPEDGEKGEWVWVCPFSLEEI